MAVAATGDVDRFASLLSPTIESVDHRLIGLPPVRGRDQTLELIRSLYDLASDVRLEIQEIVRLDHDNDEHARDIEQTATLIRFSEDHDAWPRSPNACERYRRMCEYFPVCSGESSIDDGTRYVDKTAQHEELEP